MAANAGSVNQFLGAHQAQFLYAGGSVITQGSSGSGIYQSSATQWYSQLITTTSTQTSLGSVNLQISTIGGSPVSQLIPPLVVSLYADLAGLPVGPALGSNTLTSNYVYSAPFWLTVPLPVLGLAPSTNYHVVIQMVGSSTAYYVWQGSRAVSGAATSADGVAWTNQAYGLMYQVFDQSGAGLLQFTYEDGGDRWSQMSYNSQGQLSRVTEFTVAQTTTGNLQGTRTLSYTNGVLTGVS